eukprot:2151862-Amphidinium_carterae.1
MTECCTNTQAKLTPSRLHAMTPTCHSDARVLFVQIPEQLAKASDMPCSDYSKTACTNTARVYGPSVVI